MVQVADVALPTGVPSTGPTIQDICAELAAKTAGPGSEGLKDLLIGLLDKLTSTGETEIHIVLVRGRVHSLKVRAIDEAERVYFPREEMARPQTQVGTEGS